MGKPWIFQKDINQDGVFTISDVQGWIIQLYFLPGEFFLYILINYFSSIALFFEIDPGSSHGVLSGLISFIAWVLVVFWISAMCFLFVEAIQDRKIEPIEHTRNKLGYDKNKKS